MKTYIYKIEWTTIAPPADVSEYTTYIRARDYDEMWDKFDNFARDNGMPECEHVSARVVSGEKSGEKK